MTKIKYFKLTILKLLIIAITMFVPTSTYAVEIPDISAGKKDFDFSSGCYVLTNNVYVHWKNRELTIRADNAKAQIGSQKVWANGNISLEWKGMTFKCDSLFVKGKEKTADVLGSVDFNQDGIVKITSNVAKYSWGTKLADFYGKVNLKATNKAKINLADGIKIEKDKINGQYAHICYDVRNQTIIELDKIYDEQPSTEFPEPDPSEE